MWSRTVQFNLAYVQAVKSLKWGLFQWLMVSEFRIPLYVVGVTVMFVYLLVLIKKGRRETVILGLFLVAGLVATLSGGVVYFHHFVQIGIGLVGISLWGHKHLRGWGTSLWLLVMLTVAGWTLWNYASTDKYRKDIDLIIKTSQVQELKKSNYLKVITYFPQLNVKLGMPAPDEYYQPFYISKLFNNRWEKEAMIHKNINKEIAEKTVWVAVLESGADMRLEEEYLYEYGHVFGLVKTGEVKLENIILRIYYPLGRDNMAVN
jgi:hypothetical protein